MTALIGALRVSLSADTANFEAGMKRAQRTTQASSASIQKSLGVVKGALGAFGVALSAGLFVNVIKGALEYAGHLGELADTLGITTKDLQTFSFAAGQVGISQESLQKGIQKLTISMGQAQLGAQKQQKAFQAVGISLDEIKNKSAGDVFRMLADKLQKVTDRSQRAAVEVALFGKAGAQLDNLLSGSQGSLDELTKAAERLGIVLSEDQIRHADETADKLAAVKTVLSANIAGAVADNANSILLLANALLKLVSVIPKAIQGWSLFLQLGGTAFGAIRTGNNPVEAVKGALAQNNNAVLGARFRGDRAAMLLKNTGGVDIGKFLAPSGQKKAKEDHSAVDALNAAHQFDQDLRRSQMDVLHAAQDLAKDYIERGTISLDIINAEKAAYDADLQYQTALYKLTKGKEGLSDSQAAQLKAQDDIKVDLEKEAVWTDLNEHRAEDVFNLGQHDLDRRKDVLQAQEQIATTAAERRKIELELLDIAYKQKRQALEYTIATSKDIAAVEDARRDLENLNKTYASDRQGVMQSTAGPLESYFNQLPHTADQINEALENIEVQGIDGLANALAHAGEGWESMRDIAISTLQQITSELIKLGIQKMIFSLLGNLAGGGGGVPTLPIPAFGTGINGGTFATGGFVSGPGGPTSDSVPAMLSNGEYVMSAQAVRKFGVGYLDAMNGGGVPHMKGGGLLKALSFLSPALFLQQHHLLKYISPAAFLFNKVHSGDLGALKYLSPAAFLGDKLFGGKDGHTFNINVNAPNTGNPTRDRQTSLQQAADIRMAIANANAQGLA